MIAALAECALRILARDSRPIDSDDAVSVWNSRHTGPGGSRIEIRCSGPDLPPTVPQDTIFPSEIPKDLKWRGTHRLIVSAPLVVLDLSWRSDDPLRIMAFGRGDWESHLERLAWDSSRPVNLHPPVT